ncbi:phospho-acceptor domain-containing protein [Anaerobacterium chartisolvens]|uniref:histidine kinase n=1 Tax=Anaerobacterium chartisolvens TaxID=1297424 RepID=A0A369BA81_9FIRM|nr:HAMP domain-containing sensor histidine kinase [Anaerobacterium chartisolvens]RCX18311.1 phospho-acceptor domain-containing protein [Anaerobacterium chartisolvens]
MLKKFNNPMVPKLFIALSLSAYVATRAGIIFLLGVPPQAPLSSGPYGVMALGGMSAGILLYFALDTFPIILAILFAFIAVKNFSSRAFAERNMYLEDLQIKQCELDKQRQLVDNLVRLNREASECSQLKIEFFCNISHELKTPLSVILGAIQLIDKQGGPVASERKNSARHFKTIKQNCYRLVRLLNNVLDITRIDSGYVKLNMSSCNVVYLIEEITQSIVPFAEQKDLTVEFDTESEEIFTSIDIDKIERVVLNLLSNAIKFTPPGGKVSVSVSSDSASKNMTISVKDTGPGIPSHMHGVIFERFRQVSSPFTVAFEGNGIGLSLTKSFVEIQNGSISVNSEEGKGSEFIIKLPIVALNSSSSAESPNTKSHNKIIEAINIEFSEIYSAAS